MPTGYEFSQELKQLAFNVIKFVEIEKNGPVIPLNNINDRLQSMLVISLASVKRLKQEMTEEQETYDGRKASYRTSKAGQRQPSNRGHSLTSISTVTNCCINVLSH